MFLHLAWIPCMLLDYYGCQQVAFQLAAQYG